MRARRKSQKGADQVRNQWCAALIQLLEPALGPLSYITASDNSCVTLTAAVRSPPSADNVYDPNPCVREPLANLKLKPCMSSPDCCMIQRHLALSVSPARFPVHRHCTGSCPEPQTKLSQTCDSLSGR